LLPFSLQFAWARELKLPKDKLYPESDSNVVLVGQLVKPPRI